MFIDSAGLVINDGAYLLGSNGSDVRGFGGAGEMLQGIRFDPGLLRPYIETSPTSPLRGRPCVTVNTGRQRFNERTKQLEPVYAKYLVRDLQERGINSPVFNATTLTKEAWVMLDTAVVRATRQRLRAWADLSARNPRGGFNGMSKMTLEYQSANSAGEAVKDMDGLADGRRDRHLLNLLSVPLPITHSDFYFSERELAVARNTALPLDTAMAEEAGFRVAELIEKTLVGTETGVTYGTRSGDAAVAHTGTSTEFGYTNFTYRVTKTDLTTPTGSNPEAVKQDVIEMRETMYTNGFFGPFILYTSTSYDAYLDDDYFRSGSTSIQRTLRERIESIEGIEAVRRLDYLTSGYQMVLVQMTPNVCQAINGMDVTTVQWESQGGMRKNFKVMAIQVPLLKAQYNGTSGIIHGTTS